MSFEIPSAGPGLEPKVVNQIHQRSDVDSASTAQHHTLGIKNTQSSPGDHIHDGRSSKKLLEDTTLPSDTTSASWRTAVDQALQKLGAIKL